MVLFFTADTHFFGDHRTIAIHRRPFASLAEMDEALVAGWNAVVDAEDEIWHFGDGARRSADVARLLAQLMPPFYVARNVLCFIIAGCYSK